MSFLLFKKKRYFAFSKIYGKNSDTYLRSAISEETMPKDNFVHYKKTSARNGWILIIYYGSTYFGNQDMR